MRGGGPRLHGEQAVDDEGHHHAAHMAQELGYRQHTAWHARALHHRALAEGFQRRAGGGPHEASPWMFASQKLCSLVDYH